MWLIKQEKWWITNVVKMNTETVEVDQENKTKTRIQIQSRSCFLI